MSVAIPWIGFMSTLLVIMWAASSGLLSMFTDHSNAFRNAQEVQAERLHTRISVDSTDVSIINESGGKCFTSYLVVDTKVGNSGDEPIEEFADVDLVLAYTSDSGAKVSEHQKYVSSNVLDDQWTVQSISPDNFGTNIWDPEETATLRARPSPLPQTGSLGTVLLAAPQGVTDSAYVDFDYNMPISNDCRYLHNNPTPATGDTDRQFGLPVDKTVPTSTTLYNYDQDVDANPGRTIAKAGAGPGETDPAKYQTWRTAVLSEPLTLEYPVAVDLWAASQGYQLSKLGIVTVFFRDYDGSTYTEIGQGTMFSTDWQDGSSSFVRKTILVPKFDYTVPAGNQLEVELVVENAGASEMWFAYDTESYQSLVNLSYATPTYTTFYYLHNNPTPPTGNTNMQAVLPMDTTAPTATTLYDYSNDFNPSAAGRTLQKTSQGVSESLLKKHQVWRSGALAGDLAITGDVSIDVWGASANFTQAKTGIITVYLRDYNGSTHTEIGNGSAYAADWQDGSGTWVKRSIVIPELSYTVSSGNELEVFMVVELQAGSNMWVAYDTTSYTSVLKIP